MHSPADYRDGFVGQNIIDELMCRCLDQATFGTELDNEENDVPLYDQFNRGLVLTEQGVERNPLQIEGMQKRPGLTGYIPSAEEGISMGASPKPKTLLLQLAEPDEDKLRLSAKPLGLMR